MDGDKEGFKRSFFGGVFLDVSKLCWQKLPEEVCGCSGESLLHRREFEALRRGTSDHLLAWGNFWSSPSVTAHPFRKGKAHVVLRGPPTICVDGRWWRELRFGGGRVLRPKWGEVREGSASARWGWRGAMATSVISEGLHPALWHRNVFDVPQWESLSSLRVFQQHHVLCQTSWLFKGVSVWCSHRRLFCKYFTKLFEILKDFKVFPKTSLHFCSFLYWHFVSYSV